MRGRSAGAGSIPKNKPCRERSACRAFTLRGGFGGASTLPSNTQWHRVEGIWYEVKLRKLDGSDLKIPSLDALLRRAVTAVKHKLLNGHCGSGSFYAHEKRQLDGETLRRHGLAYPMCSCVLCGVWPA